MELIEFAFSLVKAVFIIGIKLWYLWVIPIIILAIPYLIKYICYKKSGYKGSSFKKLYIDNDAEAIGAYGEMLIYNELKKIKNGKVLNNVYLYDANGNSTEIDLMFIHPTGIYVIESKNLSGLINGADKYPQWLQKYKRKVYKFANPIMQNEKHIKYINEILNHEYDEHTYNIVVLSDRCSIGNIDYNHEKARVLKRENLLKVINRII